MLACDFEDILTHHAVWKTWPQRVTEDPGQFSGSQQMMQSAADMTVARPLTSRRCSQFTPYCALCATKLYTSVL